MGLPLPIWALFGAVAVVTVMTLAAVRNSASRPTLLGWALIVGGAAGNLTDRLRHRPRFPDHAVVDWIAAPWLPTFNLADVAILVGLAFVVFSPATSPLPERTAQSSTRS